MLRYLVIAVVLLIAALGVAITYRAFSHGAWIGGVLYGVLLPTLTLYQWLTLRRTSEVAQKVADEMIWPVVLLLIALAAPALDFIEGRWLGP